MINFKVNRLDFLLALQNVSNAVRDNRTIASVSGVYLDVKNDSIEVKGTDLEVSVSATLKAEVINPGITVVKANTLQEYLKEIDDKYIQVQEIGTEIVINTEKSSSSYSTMNHQDYPDTFSFMPSTFCNIDSTLLLDGLEKTIVGAATSPDNLAVHSVRLDIFEGSMKIVTSDTYRLFMYQHNIALAEDLAVKATIPLKTAQSLIKIIGSVNPKEIKVSSTKTVIFFEIGNVKVLSKLIDLPYPDYLSIISSLSFDKEVLCQRESLISVLKRMIIFARNNTDIRNGAKLSFNDDTLEIEAASDIAKLKEKVNTIKKGSDFYIALNVKFILDFLQQISGDVLMQFKDENTATLMKSKDNDNLTCIAMPLSWG
jgi:DNA polymerase-3 subunit beta